MPLSFTLPLSRSLRFGVQVPSRHSCASSRRWSAKQSRGKCPLLPPRGHRRWLAPRTRAKLSVHGVFAGPVDTDMSRAFDVPKDSPESVAQAIFDGLEEGEEDIFPDSASQTIAESWRTSAAKALEHQNAAFVKGEG